MTNPINPSISNRTAIIETFGEVLGLLKSGTQDTVAKAIDVFSKAPKESREGVYEALFTIAHFADPYWGCAEDAFNDQKGLSSTPEQKANAILNYLIQLVSSANLKDPAANTKAIHILLSTSADLFSSGAANAMDVFSRLPREIREGIYGELYHLNSIPNAYWGCAEDAFHHRNGQSSSQEQKVQAFQNYLLRSIAELFSKGDDSSVATAKELFSRMSVQARSAVYGELYRIVPFANDYYECAEDAFHDRKGQNSSPQKKAEAIQKYLLQTLPVPKLTDEQRAEQRKAAHIEALEKRCPALPEANAENQTSPLYFRRHQANYQADPSYTLTVMNGAEIYDKYYIKFDNKTGDLLCKGKIYTSLDDLFHYYQSMQAQLIPKQPALGQKKAEFKREEVQVIQPMQDGLIPTEPALTLAEAAFEKEEAQELFGCGQRSVAAHYFSARFTCYDRGRLKIGNDFYLPITGNTQDFSTNCTASVGSSQTREIILLDPKNSPLLDAHYSSFRKTLKPGMSTYEVLTALRDYVRGQVFPSCVNNQRLEDKIHGMLSQAKTSGPTTGLRNDSSVKIPLMSIDEFIKTGDGVCRHHAMVTVNFIDRLLKEENPLIEGTVQHIRGNIDSGGAHVWTTFIPKHKNGVPPEKYHLDTFWGFLENYAEDNKILNVNYGPKMIADQIARTKNAAKRNHQPEG